MYNNTKTFSQSEAVNDHLENPEYISMIDGTSRSEVDSKNRQKVYSEVMNRYENLLEVSRSYSGTTEIPLLSNQYFNATMASYVRSFAGFLTIERSMDEPTALLWYNDLLGVTDSRKVLPNIGDEQLSGINARFQTSAAFISAQTEYTVSTNKKLIPGSIEIQLIHAATPNSPIIIKDDRNGNLLAPAGVLIANTGGELGVEYATGVITFNLGTGFVPVVADDKYSVIGYEDVAGDPAFGTLSGPGNNRFKIDMKNLIVTSEPDLLVGESNLMGVAAAQKSIGMNPQEVIGNKLTELYTKLINEKLTAEVQDNAMGNSVEINMTAYSTQFMDFNSRLEAFQGDLVDVDTAMAKSTTKATRATAYLVGETVGNWFRKLKGTGNFVDNTESTYVNDLMGYYNGVPVLRHTNIDANQGYAIHKTPGGEVAPVMRGIYLPLTSTPIVGNYNNPTQVAQGVYYQDANKSILPELVQKFHIA